MCATLVLLACTPLFAAGDSGSAPSQYTLGDQTMSINAGLFIPLFLLPTGTVLLSGSPPHLSLGGVGSLWGPFLGAFVVQLINRYLWLVWGEGTFYLMIIGAAICAVVLFIPNGVVGLLETEVFLPRAAFARLRKMVKW